MEPAFRRISMISNARKVWITVQLASCADTVVLSSQLLHSYSSSRRPKALVFGTAFITVASRKEVHRARHRVDLPSGFEEGRRCDIGAHGQSFISQQVHSI